MKQGRQLLVAGIAGLMLAGCSSEAPETQEPVVEQPLVAMDGFPGEPVATVNGQPIPEDLLMAYLRMRGQINADPERRQAAIRELVDLYLLAEDARSSGLLDRDSTRAMLAVQKLSLVANQAVAEYAQGNPVTEAEIEAEYAETLGRTGEREYLVHHILTEDEAAARQIVERLEQGEAFTEIEQAHAEQYGASSAGELGWINLAQVPPALGEAVETLEPGRYTVTPVQSEYGWHVVLLEDSRELEPPPLEDVTTGIRNNLGRQRVEEYLSRLRAEAEIDVPTE